MLTKEKIINKIEFILQRNAMYGQYDDSEDGSFSEGEKVLALIDAFEQGVREETAVEVYENMHKEFVKTVALIIGADDKIRGYTQAGTPFDDCVRSVAYFRERKDLRAEQLHRAEELGYGLEEKEDQGKE